MARFHFLKAHELNPSNSVLKGWLGIVFEALGEPIAALEFYEKSGAGNPMSLFQKAGVLMGMGEWKEAAECLEETKRLAPREACVRFQLGKVYAELGEEREALQHFNAALDLNKDSRDHHTIKTHIEGLQKAE